MGISQEYDEFGLFHHNTIFEFEPARASPISNSKLKESSVAEGIYWKKGFEGGIFSICSHTVSTMCKSLGTLSRDFMEKQGMGGT